MTPPLPKSTLARAVSLGTSPDDLLPELHRELLDELAARWSVILERSDPDDGGYRATSGRGFRGLGDVWLRGPGADRLAAGAPGDVVVMPASDLPGLEHGLTASRLIVAAVPGHRGQAVLLVGDPATDEAHAVRAGTRAATEFGVALEWSRLAREGSVHRRLRELSLGFSRGLSSTISLGPALDAIAHETNVLLGTRRTSIWLHDRRARELALVASSDPVHASTATRIAVDAPGTLARGMRLERPEFLREEHTTALVAPLRGWRRALGTLVVEDDATAALDRDLLVDLTDELGRHLSAGIENVQLLEEVLRQRRLLEDTFNSLVDLVVVTDRALRIVQINDTFAVRVGRRRTDLLEQPLAEVIGRELAEWTRGAERTSAGDDQESDSNVRTLTFDDEQLGGTFAATVTPLINEDGEPVGRVLVVRDISVQTRLEADQEALRARLAQSEKLAALGQFVAGIAHEMNNPLQGVLGHIELLIEASEPARPIRRELRRIYHEADRAAKIVRNLLVFTGSRRMSRRRLRIERVIARVVASRRGALSRAAIGLVRRQEEHVPAISGDPLLLQQAFLNVLMNAEHAIAGAGRPGTITIATAADTTGGTVVTTVTDTGPGISPSVLPRIFDPFFTTKDVGKGTGLGLAITYGIIQEHGGAIHASNAPEGGAVFTIELPAI